MSNIMSDPLDIPPFLKRDASNKAEYMMADNSVSEVESRPAKTKVKAAKPNGHDEAPVKAASAPKAKAAVKAKASAKTAPKATATAAKAAKLGKVAKPKAEKAEKDAWGFRKGSAKSKAVEMYCRKNGATLAEVKERVGSVQLNVLKALIAEGKTVETVKEVRKGQRPVTRYILKA